MSKADTFTKFVAGAGETTASDIGVDWALVQEVQSGKVAAFDQLVQKYRVRIFSMIYNMTGNREDANDLAQDTFIKAFQSIHHFRGKSSFYTWLYRIAANHTLSFLRKNRRRRFFSFENIEEEASTGEIFETLASRTRTDKPVLLRELQERLNESLQKLSEKHRIVVVLHEIEGLNHSEIADITGTSEGTVRSRLHYAKQFLQNDLSSYLK